MLRLPEEGESAPPLVRERRSFAVQRPAGYVPVVAASVAVPEGFKARSGSRGRRSQDVPEWEDAGGTEDGSRVQSSLSHWWALSGLVGVGLVVTVLVLVFRSQPKNDVTQPNIEPPATIEPKITNEAAPLGKTVTEATTEPVEAGVGDRETTATTFLAGGKAVVEKFVAAKTVDEIIPLIRGGEAMRSLVANHYKDVPLEPSKLLKFAENGGYALDGSIFSTTVGLDDYSSRSIALERTEGGAFLVDWESWVGWCEMNWETFRENKPTEPKFFRTNAKAIDYYNFLFADESKWRCYRLSALGDEVSLYGYVERGSQLEQAMTRAMKSNGTASVIVRLAYPAQSPSADQVKIVEFVQDGWISPQAPTIPVK